jgi:iron complex outermembrane receptor protein
MERKFTLNLKLSRRIVILLLLIFQQHYLFSQQTIRGDVKNNGESLIGVSVKSKTGNVVAQTDVNGRFSINALVPGTLIFAYVGFKTLEVAVTQNSELHINMEVETRELDNVVVIGYGSVKKSDVFKRF